MSMSDGKNRHPGGVFRDLYAMDHVHYAAHLKRLSPEDRASRFHVAVNDARITQHARAAMTSSARVLGWFERGQLRAAAEKHLSADGQSVEAAFEVEADFRNRGVGTELVARTLLWARNRGARRVLIQTGRRNLPMLRAAQKNGAAFEFDLAEADGVIEAARPSVASHLREAMQNAEGALRWFTDAARLRFTPFL